MLSRLRLPRPRSTSTTIDDEIIETVPDAPAADHRHRDAGYTFTEMLIALVLTGFGVVSVLTSLQVSVSASVIDREQAVAFAWLQAASDEIFLDPRIPCTSDGQGRLDAIAAYNSAAQQADPPPVWVETYSPTTQLLGSASISVIDVEYLGRVNPDAAFEWSPTFCFEGASFADSPLYTQRVTVQVTFPDGFTMQTLEMVKSER